MDNDDLREFITDKMSLKMVYTSGEALKEEIIGSRGANEELIGFLR